MLIAFDEDAGVREVVGSLTSHTSTRMTGRMEVVGRVSGRRRWSDAEKLEILAEAFRPGVRVCDVIARREVSSSLIYTGRKQWLEGKVAGVVPSLPVFAEVQIAEPPRRHRRWRHVPRGSSISNCRVACG